MGIHRFALGSALVAVGFVYACGDDEGGGGGAPPAIEAGTPEASTSDASVDASPQLPTDAPVNEQYVGGKRLKPKFVQAADGTRGLVGWHDTLLDVDCSFQKAMDGELRCLPFKNRAGNQFDRGFVADGCNGAALMVDKRDPSARDTCGPEKFFPSTDDTTCPPKTRIELVGAASNATSYWYSEGACQMSGLDQGWKLYSLTAEVPPAEWVKGTLANEPAKDGLSPAFVTGEDGSKGFFGWVDAAHGDTPCGFARAADGETRCLPFDNWGIVWEDLFSDGNCTSYVAQGLYTKCSGGFGRRYDDRGSCTPKFSVHPILGPYTGADVYRGKPGSCVGQSASGNEWYATGPEIPATQFSSIKAGDRVGTARLQRSRSITSGGWVSGGGFYDTKRDEGCSFTTAADGKLRCMPFAPQPVGYYFADDACKVPLYRVYEQCGAIVPKYGAEVDRTTCPARTSLYMMGARHTGPVYERYGVGACTLNGGSASSLVLHVRAAEVPAIELEEGTEVVP